MESYHTVPEEIYAGDEFELILNMKNASTSVPASNILFNLESEKVSDSAVFTTESGTLLPGGGQYGSRTDHRGQGQVYSQGRSGPAPYAITVKEKYDSPEFKNAEESIVVDIPCKAVCPVKHQHH